jgi:uncharacterized protein YggE
MRKLCWLLAIPVIAFAQLDDNTLTVTATRTLNVQPDQVVVQVDVAAQTLSDALQIVSPAGITASNFNSFDTVGFWTFQLTVPFDKLSTTIAGLAKLRSSAGQSVVGYGILDAQISPAARKCPYPALMSDAQAQAQQVASAAGVKLGPVLAISDAASAGALVLVPRLIYAGNIVPGISAGPPIDPTSEIASLSSVLSSQPVPSPTCTMTVQFQLSAL